MIREAELFVMAEQVLVEVVGRIRAEHWSIVMPPLFGLPRTDAAAPLRERVERYAQDNARLPGVLAGTAAGDRTDGEILGDDAHATVRELSAAACAAVGEVTDGAATVKVGTDAVPVRAYLLEANIARCFLANRIANHLGSTACPLTEELARGMWEATEPEADRWRGLGIFRDPPLPLPPHVSWRDRFMLTAGRKPHALD